MASISNIFSLRGRNALVTGGGSGLGASFARALARAGASVAVCGRRIEKLEEVVGNLRSEGCADGANFGGVQMDVTSRRSVRKGFDDAEKMLNVNRGDIDIIVNSAGVSGNPRTFLGISEQDYNCVMDTNLKGTFLVSQEGSKRMKFGKRKGGAVINVGSILGLGVARGVAPYAASKAGVIHLTKAMASELISSGIRVNAILPGYFLTEMNEEFFETDAGKEAIANQIPCRRLGEAQELDGALLLLASDAGSYINGTHLVVDGGHLCKGLMA